MKNKKLSNIINKQDSYLKNNYQEYIECETCQVEGLCIFKALQLPDAPEDYVNSCKERFFKTYDTETLSWCSEQTINLAYSFKLSTPQFMSLIKIGDGNGLCLCRSFIDYVTKIPNCLLFKASIMETE